MQILLVIQVIIAVSLVVIVLIQQPSSDGLSGFGGASSGNAFLSGRASADILTKITTILATAFIVNCLLMAKIASEKAGTSSIVEKYEQIETPKTEEAPEAIPVVPQSE